MSERRISFFDTKIEYLKGVGPSKAEILNKELTIFTFGDLIEYYPFRHEDRTQFHRICDLNDTMAAAQIKGRLRSWEKVGEGAKARLVGQFTDGTGVLELTWFQGITWVEKNLRLKAIILFTENQVRLAVNGKLRTPIWMFSHPKMNEVGIFNQSIH